MSCVTAGCWRACSSPNSPEHPDIGLRAGRRLLGRGRIDGLVEPVGTFRGGGLSGLIIDGLVDPVGHGLLPLRLLGLSLGLLLLGEFLSDKSQAR